MSKKLDNYDVSCELMTIKHLLFFLGESLESISNQALKYRRMDFNGDKMLAHEANRHIDQLNSLQSVLYDKVAELEKKFDL